MVRATTAQFFSLTSKTCSLNHVFCAAQKNIFFLAMYQGRLMFLKSVDKPLDTTHFGSFDSITKPLNIKLNETSFFFFD